MWVPGAGVRGGALNSPVRGQGSGDLNSAVTFCASAAASAASLTAAMSSCLPLLWPPLQHEGGREGRQ